MIKQLIIKFQNNRYVYQLYKCIISSFSRVQNNYRIRFELRNGLKLDRFNRSAGSDFFGYYNVSPWNLDGDSAIFLKHQSKKPIPKYSLPVDIVSVKDTNKIIDTTYSWNWQQGSMLQWYDTDKIIYNYCDSKKGIVRTKIFNINLNEIVLEIDKPFYTLSNDKKFALTLRFSRLNSLRPEYGYKCMKSHKTDPLKKGLEEDGIFLIDFATQKSYLLLSFEDIISFQSAEDMKLAEHKINHLDVNPSDTKVMFLHRWFVKGVKRTRLLVYDLKTKQLNFAHGNKMVSHCCWLNENDILGFCFLPSIGNCYTIFEAINKEKKVLDKLPVTDGHPSKSPTSDWIVTDTYPDKMRMAKLILYNLKTEKIVVIGKFYQPCRFVKELRIDLHPKWSPDGRQIAFESGHTGFRKLYYVDISKVLAEK